MPLNAHPFRAMRSLRDVFRRERASAARRSNGDQVQISRYHCMLAAADPRVAEAQLPDQEWGDLAMDHVFVAIDHTSAPPGQQCLYHRLRTPAREPDAARRAATPNVRTVRNAGNAIAGSPTGARTMLGFLNTACAWADMRSGAARRASLRHLYSEMGP